MKNSPLVNIRRYCMWCCLDNPNEVRFCPAEDCALHPLRFGRAKKGYSTLGAIKKKCRDCGEGTSQAVEKCEFPECQLFMYRKGHNPALVGKRGKGNPKNFRRVVI